MTKIKEGFGGKELEIRILTDRNDLASIWTEQFIDKERLKLATNGRQEQLHYATITELIELRDEINNAIKELAGV